MKKLFYFLLLPIVMASCVRPYYVSINTFADMNVIPYGFSYGCSFAIVSENQDHSLFTKEVAYKLNRFLQERGYCVCDINKAQYVLTFNYDMQCSKELVNVPVYVPGPTQVREGCMTSREGTTVYQETTMGLGTTVYVPEEVVIYHRKLCVNVYDSSHYLSEQKEAIWQGVSQSTGSHGDFRETIDYLLVSAFRFFGLNTKKSMHIRLDEKDPAIQWLRH